LAADQLGDAGCAPAHRPKTSRALLAAADMAMYRVKRTGRDSYAVHDV
jgi:GGDEF domain-containing protein